MKKILELPSEAAITGKCSVRFRKNLKLFLLTPGNTGHKADGTLPTVVNQQIDCPKMGSVKLWQEGALL